MNTEHKEVVTVVPQSWVIEFKVDPDWATSIEVSKWIYRTAHGLFAEKGHVLEKTLRSQVVAADPTDPDQYTEDGEFLNLSSFVIRAEVIPTKRRMRDGR